MKMILNRILFKIYVFFIGFRFYHTSIDNSSTIYNNLTINFNEGKPLVFNFYRTMVDRNYYRFGKMKMSQVPLYGIGTQFANPDFPELTDNYNNRVMSFYIPYFKLLSEDSLSRYILELYIDYISKQIKSSELPIGRRQGTNADYKGPERRRSNSNNERHITIITSDSHSKEFDTIEKET